MYYLSYTSQETGSSTNDRVLVYDILRNVYSVDILSVNGFCAFNSGTDWGVLYSGSSTDGIVYAYSDAGNEVVHKKHADFTGTWNDMGYIPTGVGGDANDPVLELRWTETLDEVATTINNTSGVIDRPDTDGTYISQVFQVALGSFDKLYWNERFSPLGGDVLAYTRSGTTDANCQAEDWSDAFTNPSGSDISGETANEYVQYKFELSTDDISETPIMHKSGNYVVRFTYLPEGTVSEPSIDLHWQGGFTDLGHPGKVKYLKKIIAYHEGTVGTLSLKFETFVGDTDTFDINLADNPERYEGYFTNGMLVGEKFKLDITESSLLPIKVGPILVVYDVEKMY